MIDVVSYGRPAPRVSRAAAPTSAALPMDASRVAWVDVAKGICIVLVVTMHATLSVEAEMGTAGFMHWVIAYSKPFRMPDFFLVSGLFLSRVIDRDWRSYADKRVVHFMYFYVLWLVIQSTFKVAQVSGGSVSGFFGHIAAGLIEPYSTLWFIYVLAVFSVVTKLMRRVAAPIILAAGAALQILPVQTGSYLVNEVCAYWVYFLAGYLFAPHVFRLADWARAHAVKAIAALALWAVVNGVVALAPVTLAFRGTVAELPVISLFAGLAGAVAITVLASLVSRLRLSAPLRYAGSHSIVVYLTFFLPMALTRFALVQTGLIEDAGSVAATVTIVAVIVPLAIERFVRPTRFAFLYRRPAWARIPGRRERKVRSPAPRCALPGEGGTQFARTA